MNVVEALVERKLGSLSLPVAVVMPAGQRVGPADARLTLNFRDLGSIAHITSGQVGRLAEEYVEGRIEIEGSPRDLATAAAELVSDDPTRSPSIGSPLHWWRKLVRMARSAALHTTERDARQIQFHYDVSDDFYALWLDPKRVYSCAYYRERGMALAQAQEAKLDHICRKLRLQPGERFLDIGAGWGGLLLWAAEHYGVRATGITLSKNQHVNVTRLIQERGLQGRVSMQLRDYRELPEDEPFDKIASVGMFEHVGRAQLLAYFAKISRLLRRGGLLMNHGITAGGTENHQLGAGLGDFIERYIFPGGELLHVSQALRLMSEADLEMVDTENLRPHYARTLWDWSDALEARLAEARRIVDDRVLRAYRLYLAGSAMAFERGWISLHQMLASKPSGRLNEGAIRAAQSDYPFNREYMYARS